MQGNKLLSKKKNIDAFACRMNGRKSWSKKGANNLSKVIVLKMDKGFNDKKVKNKYSLKT